MAISNLLVSSILPQNEPLLALKNEEKGKFVHKHYQMQKHAKIQVEKMQHDPSSGENR